jgi:pilus assembly protein TadC
MAVAKQARVPFVLLNYRSMEELSRRMGGLTKALKGLRPRLDAEFDALGIDIKPEYYRVGCLLSALVYGLLGFCLVVIVLMGSQAFDMRQKVLFGAATGFVFFVLFFGLQLYWPRMMVKTLAARSDKDLLFALREIMLSINSGIPIFYAMKNVSLGGYGQVSVDFGRVVKQVESGVSEKEALRSLALLTESEYFRRALWQMINVLETGSSMSTALPGIVDALELYTYRNIRAYTANLNFLMLIYMLIAAAIPSLGITFLVLLSAFSGIGVTMDKILMLIIGAAIGQVVLIGYMASSRPDVFGG